MMGVAAWLRGDRAGGILLMASAAFALLLAQLLPGSETIAAFLVGTGDHPPFWTTPRLLANDGLMAIFFVMAGVEIRSAISDGPLSSWRHAALPVVAAFCGAAVPAGCYLLVAWPTGADLHGWPIPAATDIALAAGLVALFGTRLPAALRTFILTLAVVDDVIAALIIATVFSGELVPSLLLLAGGITAVLAVFSWRGISGWWWYLALGLALWWACHEGGIHPTLAGVATGLAIPSGRTGERAEHGLRLVVHLVVLPLFVMVNAFIPISSDNLSEAITGGMAYAIALGLIIGKPLGVVGGTVLALKTGLAHRDDGLTWRIILGASLAAGMGFTMSIFMAELAFSGRDEVRVAKLAILAASLLAGIMACAVFAWVARRDRDVENNNSDGDDKK